MSIGKLTKVPLRELWRHEERGFSEWLADHLEVLSEAIGIRLSEASREVAAGSFQVDLVVEDDGGDRVIVENQLESTNHDHLGKVITYLTNLDAKTAIWIAKDPRPEHIKAIAWLNETSPDDTSFFLVRLEAYRIGTSEPAPLFTVMVGPSPEARGFGRQKKDFAERHVLRLKFWEELLDRARKKGLNLHSGRSPTKDSWISAGAGRTGISFTYVIWSNDDSAVEVYIDTGDKEENKSIFDSLFAKRDEIEATFGNQLEWERLNDRRACLIRYTIRTGGLRAGEAQWPEIQDKMVGAMEKLAKAMKGRL